MSTKLNFAAKHRTQRAAEHSAIELYAQLGTFLEVSGSTTLLADMTKFTNGVIEGRATLLKDISDFLSKAAHNGAPIAKQRKLHKASLERAATYLEYIAQSIRCSA